VIKENECKLSYMDDHWINKSGLERLNMHLFLPCLHILGSIMSIEALNSFFQCSLGLALNLCHLAMYSNLIVFLLLSLPILSNFPVSVNWVSLMCHCLFSSVSSSKSKSSHFCCFYTCLQHPPSTLLTSMYHCSILEPIYFMLYNF
jgi:hypothetical protein